MNIEKHKTLAPGLSLSSITTNIRIGSGGAFSLISQSLGMEIGGVIGISFYFTLAVAVAMYIFGFREGLSSLFPEISHLILDAEIFILVMVIPAISKGFAYKNQYLIRRNWNGNINLIILNTQGNNAAFTNEDYLLLNEGIRLPKNTIVAFLYTSFETAIFRVKHADVNIFSLSKLI